MRIIVVLGILRWKTLKCDQYEHDCFTKLSNLIEQFSKQEFPEF